MILPDINLNYLDFPKGKTHEAVTLNEDGSYTVFIDAKLSQEERAKKYLHALTHIIGEDFGKENVQEIEKEAHKKDRTSRQ